MQKLFSTFRRKIILSIIFTVFAAIGIFGFVACSDEMTEDDLIRQGYTVAVVYDFNGGTVNNSGFVKIRTKENSSIPAPRKDKGAVGIPVRTNYSFKAFYRAVLDEKGNVAVDDDGNAIIEGEPWNFETDKVTDEDITLVAAWWDNYDVVLHYGEEYEKTQTAKIARNVDGTPTALYSTAFTIRDYTFISYKRVKDSDNVSDVVKFPYTLTKEMFDESDDGQTFHVWGESLAGNWTLVREAGDLKLSVLGEETQYYLLDDIDMKDAEYDDQSDTRIPRVFNGKFVGNNHKISNMTINMISSDRNYTEFGLFRTIGSKAEITDVTFENVSLVANLSVENVSYNIGLLAGTIQSGAKVQNVNFTDGDGKCSIEYSIGMDVDSDRINFADDDLIAHVENGATVSQSSVESVKLVKSEKIITADEAFLICVKYEEVDGVKVFDESSLYLFATKTRSGGYSEKTISNVEYSGNNTFVMTRIDESVYDIVVIDNGGVLSTTITKR